MSTVRRTFRGGVALLLLGALFSGAASLADHAVAPAAGTRPAGADLNKRILDFASQKFFLAPKYIDDAYRTRLPDAIIGALGSETREGEIAQIVAELFGRISEGQLKTIVTDALALRKTIEDKPQAERTPSDNEVSAFLTRILWGAKILRGGAPGFEPLAAVNPTGPKFEAFRAALPPAHELVQRANREGFYTLLDQASNGATPAIREAAQSALRSRFASVLPFLKGQSDAKNDELVRKFASAVKFENDGDGSVLDILDASKAPHRIVLGKNPEKFAANIAQAFQEYAALQAALNDMQLAPQKHGDVRGNVFRPREAPPTPPTPNADPDAKMAEWFLTNKCLKCHDQDAEGKMKLFDSKGNVLDPTRIPQILEVFQEKHVTGAMLKKIREAKASMTEADKANLRAWAAKHGVPDFDMNGKNGVTPSPSPSPPQPAPPSKMPDTVKEALKQNYFKGFVDPKTLAETLKAKGAHAPILNIGIVEDIQDAKHIGNLGKADGVRALEAFEKTLPSKNDEVIIYCGCCQLDTCPNVLTALRVLRERGYTNVRILNLPDDLETDWKAHGYPMAPTQPGG